jgi:hypothetical protein
MKRVLAAIALFAAGIAVGSAQIPAALDPVKVAPHMYQLAFENERVRVLKRTIRNGETPPLVSQPDRVVIYLNPCAWIEDDGQGGERMQDFKFGTPTWQPANTHGGDTYDVIQECRVIEVELRD